jgi:hypothetical protein
MTSGELTRDVRGAADLLAERFAAVCESAVDPLEVASALEFDGISDRAARADYGVPDVFALARLLYARVPRRPAAPDAGPDPWPAGSPLLHGLLYAAPAVCFPAAAGLLAGPAVLPALVVALLAGWALSQGLAAIGYRRLGMAGEPAARRVLRGGLAGCLVLLGAALTATGLIAGTHPLALAFGAGEGAYMLGACVLLVLGAERWLPAALAPGVTGAALYLALGRPESLTLQAWLELAATPLLSCALAVARTRAGRAGEGADGAERDSGPGRGRLPGPGELADALPAMTLGLVAAGLLSFPVVAGVSGNGGANPGALVASVPLALSMGIAEWSLLRYRRGTRALLMRTDDPRWFRQRASLRLLAALALYLAGTVALAGMALAVAALAGQVAPGAAVLAAIAGYLVLGGAMFLVLLLQTIRVRMVPLAIAAATLGCELALRRHGLATQVTAAAVMFSLVLGYALARLGELVLHA